MQEEIQATDVLRVGRWYEDLLAGDERAKTIIKCLATGPDGADDEGESLYSCISIPRSCTHVFMKMTECITCSSFSQNQTLFPPKKKFPLSKSESSPPKKLLPLTRLLKRCLRKRLQRRLSL